MDLILLFTQADLACQESKDSFSLAESVHGSHEKCESCHEESHMSVAYLRLLVGGGVRSFVPVNIEHHPYSVPRLFRK